jgi:hypothetical protein
MLYRSLADALTSFTSSAAALLLLSTRCNEPSLPTTKCSVSVVERLIASKRMNICVILMYKSV